MIARHQISADIELANVKLLIARHAPMALARPVAGQDDKLQPVGFDRAFFERADDFVIAAPRPISLTLVAITKLPH